MFSICCALLKLTIPYSMHLLLFPLILQLTARFPKWLCQISGYHLNQCRVSYEYEWCFGFFNLLYIIYKVKVPWSSFVLTILFWGGGCCLLVIVYLKDTIIFHVKVVQVLVILATWIWLINIDDIWIKLHTVFVVLDEACSALLFVFCSIEQ